MYFGFCFFFGGGGVCGFVCLFVLFWCAFLGGFGLFFFLPRLSQTNVLLHILSSQMLGKCYKGLRASRGG